MALYVCNCGRNYGTPEERTVHMAICHVMDVYRERDKLKAEVERLRGEKQNVMDCEPRKPSCGWCVACQRQKNSDLELQINVYREELERQKNKNRGMGSIVADEILKRIQSRLEDTEKSEKGIDVDGLRDQIEWFRHYSGVESDPCPACVYKEGVLQTACGVHKTIATLELQLNAIKEEWDKNCEHWCIHGETGPCDMVELINKISREGAEGRGTKSEKGERRPKIITLCGSTRFTSQMLAEAWRLTKLGNIVIHWNILEGKEAFSHGAEREGDNIKEIIDALYLHKVAMADEVRVINVGGYVGESTTNEVQHGLKLGKPVTWLEPDKAKPELCSPVTDSGDGK